MLHLLWVKIKEGAANIRRPASSLDERIALLLRSVLVAMPVVNLAADFAARKLGRVNIGVSCAGANGANQLREFGSIIAVRINSLCGWPDDVCRS